MLDCRRVLRVGMSLLAMITALGLPARGAEEFNTLRIYFHGLVTFVPQTVDGKQRVWVVLPKADNHQAATVPVGAHPPKPVFHYLPLHHAFIKVPAKHLFQDIRPAEGAVPVFLSLTAADADLPEPERARYMGHAIFFDPPLADSSVAVNGFDDHVPRLGYLDERGDDRHHERVCVGCLDTVPIPPGVRDRIAARLLLTAGELNVDHLVPVDVYFANYVDSQKKIGSRPMQLAESVVASISYPRGPLKLKLQSLADPADIQTFDLLADANNTVTLDILNLPAEALLGRIEFTKLMDPEDIEHFRLFYILSQNKDVAPYPFPTTGTPFGGQPYCGVSQAKP